MKKVISKHRILCSLAVAWLAPTLTMAARQRLVVL